VPARLYAQTEFEMTNPRTILIVDDDVDLAEGLKLVLSREGYRILQARDGRQAKDVVDRERPDLVIIDMMMPKMGGYPVLEHYKERTDAPPFIMITANEGARHKAYAEYLGVVDYIRKPFAMDRLLETVHKVLPPEVASPN
jgi:DNA-binding response OmpR family regulator